MNELLDICKNGPTGLLPTDKYMGWMGLHSYIEHFYINIFPARRASTKNLLEIGVAGGGSVILWHNYFQGAVIHCLDKDEGMGRKFSKAPRVKFGCVDAYRQEIIDKIPNAYFDIIIDDGPHTVESQVIFVEKYLPKVAPGGILIVEDIAEEAYLQMMGEKVPEHLQDRIGVWDGTKIDNRYDSRILYIELP